MVLERVEVLIKQGQESAFEKTMLRGRRLLTSAKGCHSVTVAQGLENSTKFLLILEWETVAAHTAFTATTEFNEFRDLVGPFFAERPAMEHFSPLIVD